MAERQRLARKVSDGEYVAAQNSYRAFIDQVGRQRGKAITAFAADILIANAEYLLADCQ